MPYLSYYTRSYTLPLDLFTKIENDSTSSNILRSLFDSRYLKRDRIRLTKIEPITCEVIGYKINLSFWAMVHTMGGTTIIVELKCKKDLPNELALKIQEHWINKHPIFSFSDKICVSIREIMNAALIRLLTENAHEFDKYRKLSFYEIINDIRDWEPFYRKLFEIADYSDLRFKVPTIFGCITIVRTNETDENIKNIIEKSNVAFLEPDKIVDGNEANNWLPLHDYNLIKVNRNNAVIITRDFNEKSQQYILAIAFLNIVRHYANFLVGETSIIMDSIGRINVSFIKRSRKKKLLLDRFKLRDILNELSILKSGFIGAYDETKDISLWNSADLVYLSSSIREGKAWKLDKEIELAINKTEELEELTDLLYKEDIRRSRKVIVPIVTSIGAINLLQAIPVFKEHIIPDIIIWGPVVSILMVIILLYTMMDET